MEARTFQSGGIPTAKALIAAQESVLAKIKQPRKDLAVWLLSAKGMVALVESDAKTANQNFKTAADAAAALPEFDEIARFNLKQRLAFTYIRLGDGATAERLARELISGYSNTAGPDSPYVLRVRLNLTQIARSSRVDSSNRPMLPSDCARVVLRGRRKETTSALFLCDRDALRRFGCAMPGTASYTRFAQRA